MGGQELKRGFFLRWQRLRQATIGMKPIERKTGWKKQRASEEAEGHTIHNTETDYLETVRQDPLCLALTGL